MVTTKTSTHILEYPHQSSMLPLEILARIFEYLDDFDDLKSLTLVCKHWLKATQIEKILKNYKLCFSFVSIDPRNKPLSLFPNSDRVFSNIYFENARFSLVDPDIWAYWSGCITEITFDYKFRTLDLPGGNFVELLKYTPRLKTLNLICSLGLFNTYIEQLTDGDRIIVFDNIKNVQELQMYFGEVCLEKLNFGAWIDQMANLKNIDFDVHSKTRAIPTQAYNEILNFLKKFGSKIKGLHICDNNRAIHKTIIQQILDIEHMKLKAFDLIINSASSKIFTEFLCTQSELQYLTVNGSFSLSRSLPHMPKLKEIAISNGPPLNGFNVFNRLEKLESLGIAGLELYDDDELDETFSHRMPKLKELYLIDSTIDFGWPFVKRLCESFDNIRLLNLDGALIDDSSLFYIFQLKKLQELKLSNTTITDSGFCGTSSRKKLKLARNQAVSIDKSPISISSLKELEVLNIDFCKHLTSVSFNELKFKKLKHLSAQCTQLNGHHMESLAKNCPKIESLNLSRCTQLRENDIREIMMVKGLETLELESCTNVDLACMNQIMNCSNKLQTLNLTKCNIDVPLIAKEMFRRLESLRRIILYKERLYRCNYVNNLV